MDPNAINYNPLATNDDGSCEYVNLPVANFNYTASNDFAPTLFVFTNYSANSDTYYWDFGDGTTSTDSSPWHSYTSPGQYSILLVAYSPSCGNDSTQLSIEVIDPLSVEERNWIDMQLYPNPTSGTALLTIKSQISELVELKIIDTEGRIISIDNFNLQPGTNSYVIDLCELGVSKGQYYVSIYADTFELSKAIIYR